jgi:hypothetical protein
MSAETIVLLPVLLVASVIVVGAIVARPFFGFCLIFFIVVFSEMFAIQGDPISGVSYLLLANLRGVPIKATPLEIIMVATVAAGWSQARARGEKFWTSGITTKLWIGFAIAIFFGLIWGWRRGGDFNMALWELRGLTYSILIYFMASYFLRDWNRWKHLSWLFILGVFVLCINSLVRFSNIKGDLANTDSLNGFNHDTALFFSMFIMYMFAQMNFGSWKGHRFFTIALAPLVMFSLMISERRAAFAALIIAYGCYLVILFIRKRVAFFIILTFTILIGVPYTAAFWNSEGTPLGMPARAIKSQIAGQASARDLSSDLYRLTEKFNVHYTIMQNRWLGIGFGQQFSTPVTMLNLEYDLQLYTPHINILWIWMKIGIAGFFMFWLLNTIGLFQAAQVVKYSTAGPHLSFTLLAGFSIVIILVFGYVDIAFTSYRITTAMGIFLAIINMHYMKVLPDIEKYGGRALFSMNKYKRKKAQVS